MPVRRRRHPGCWSVRLLRRDPLRCVENRVSLRQLDKPWRLSRLYKPRLNLFNNHPWCHFRLHLCPLFLCQYQTQLG